MNNCSQCGSSIPSGKSMCSICMGDLDHGTTIRKRTIDKQLPKMEKKAMEVLSTCVHTACPNPDKCGEAGKCSGYDIVNSHILLPSDSEIEKAAEDINIQIDRRPHGGWCCQIYNDTEDNNSMIASEGYHTKSLPTLTSVFEWLRSQLNTGK